MSIDIGCYTFDGPYTDTDRLLDRAGLYAILDARPDNTYVVDIGESAEVKTRVASHDRKDCWKRNHVGTLQVAVLYTPSTQQSGRMVIEQELRDQFKPSYGQR